jgi:hypothetical protein
MERTPLWPDSARRLDVMGSEVKSLKEGLAKADGMLFELRKKTRDGKKLYVAARHVFAPKEDSSGDADPNFWGWNNQHMPMSGVLLLDVYAGAESGIVPVAHMDWSLHGDEANGSGNMHEAILPKHEYEKLAREKWATGTAFKTSPEYQKQNIGTLMVASSASVLPVVGAQKFFTGVLLQPAESTFNRFDLSEKDFFKDGKIQSLPIARLSEHELVNKTLSEFV